MSLAAPTSFQRASWLRFPVVEEEVRSMCRMCAQGRYAAVAFSTSERGFGKVREVTLFLLPREMVKQTETTVTAGSISFMGAYDMGPSTMVLQEKATDDVQTHYFEVFWGKPLVQVIADLQVMGTPAYFPVHAVQLSQIEPGCHCRRTVPCHC